VRQAGLAVQVAVILFGLFLHPVKPNQIPHNIRLQPAW
jgi:hypothetical protein